MPPTRSQRPLGQISCALCCVDTRPGVDALRLKTFSPGSGRQAWASDWVHWACLLKTPSLREAHAGHHVDGAILWSETVATETGCAWTDERVALLVSRQPPLVHVFDRFTGYEVMIPFDRWGKPPELDRVDGLCPEASESLLDSHRHAIRLFPDPRVLLTRVDWKPREERRRKASAARKSTAPRAAPSGRAEDAGGGQVRPEPELTRPCPRCRKHARRILDPETGAPVYLCSACGISFEVGGA